MRQVHYLLLILIAAVAYISTPARPPPEPREIEDKIASYWGHRREADSDLDGDGILERIVLASDAEYDPLCTPASGDVRHWGLLVENSSGQRTVLKANLFWSRGVPEAAITSPDPEGRRRVLLLESGGRSLTWVEYAYQGPGKVSIPEVMAFREVDAWVRSAPDAGNGSGSQ